MPKKPSEGRRGDDQIADDLEAEHLEAPQGIPGRRLQLIPHTVDPKLVFRFEFGPAILAQVWEQLQNLPILPLESTEVSTARYPGFYQLLRNGNPVYIGRSTRPIGLRLREHVKKLRGRVPLAQMGCRFVFVEDLSLVGLSEDALITYFQPKGLDEWGTQGFGSKVTGHGRAGQGSAWHERYPPDLRWPIPVTGGQRPLREHFSEIAGGAPLTLSVPNKYKPRFRRDFKNPIEITGGTQAFGDLVRNLERILQPDWIIDRKPMAWYIVPADAEAELETDSQS